MPAHPCCLCVSHSHCLTTTPLQQNIIIIFIHDTTCFSMGAYTSKMHSFTIFKQYENGQICTCTVQIRMTNGSFQKRSILPPWRKFLPSRGEGEKKLFLIIVNVIRTSERGKGFNFLFPLWGWYGCFLE